MTGYNVPADAFEGLPRHMVESIPLRVRVTTTGPRSVNVGGETKIALDAAPGEEWVQLERDGRGLTMADVRGWIPGEADGWRPTPIAAPSGAPDIIDIEDCEEIYDA